MATIFPLAVFKTCVWAPRIAYKCIGSVRLRFPRGAEAAEGCSRYVEAEGGAVLLYLEDGGGAVFGDCGEGCSGARR